VIGAQIRSLTQDRRLRRNSGLALASTVIVLAVGIVSAPVLAQLLPKEEYGALSYVVTLQSLVIAFSLPGLANAISYSVARGHEAHFREGTFKRARIYLRNGLVLLPVAGWFLWHEQQPELALLIALGGLLLPLTHAFDTGEQFLVGRGDFTTIFWRRTLSLVIIAGSGILAAYISANAISVFLVRGVVSAVMYISIFWLLLRTIRNDSRDVEFESKSRGFSSVSMLGTLSGQIDRLVLGTIIGLDLLAGYSLALSLSVFMESITKTLNKIIFGRMALPRTSEQRRSWVWLSLAGVLVGSLFLLAVWQFVAPLVSLLFPKYPEIITMLPLLLIGEIFSMGTSLGLIHCQFHQFALWKRYELFVSISWIPVMLVATLTAGIWGALGVRLAYAFLSFAFYNLFLWKG